MATFVGLYCIARRSPLTWVCEPSARPVRSHRARDPKAAAFRRAKIFDRCAPKDGIKPFDALVEQFMSVEPYRSAQRVFLI
ncbi:MAG: hypothetical protein LC808_44905, partial [Actinobacteria bacterium]|nr:hypothetical protein [Actinomycetota bacterium]